MQAMVQATGLSRTFGGGKAPVHALVSVDFLARAGEFVAIMGPSGSGKSTLLSILGGLDAPNEGEVWIGGRSLGGMKEAELALLRRRQVGFVFQSLNLVPVLTVAENVALPLVLDGQRGAPVQARVEEMLDQVGLTDRKTHRPAELSGGQQQRVAIARALVTRPAILLADEPTGSLDSQNSHEVLHHLRLSSERLGQTILLITHDPVVAAWADRVIFLRDGRLVGEGTLTAASAAERTALVQAKYNEVNALGGKLS